MKEITILEFLLIIGLSGAPVTIPCAGIVYLWGKKVLKQDIIHSVLFAVLELVLVIVISYLIWAFWPGSIDVWLWVIPIPVVLSQVLLLCLVLIVSIFKRQNTSLKQ